MRQRNLVTVHNVQVPQVYVLAPQGSIALFFSIVLMSNVKSLYFIYRFLLLSIRKYKISNKYIISCIYHKIIGYMGSNYYM